MPATLPRPRRPRRDAEQRRNLILHLLAGGASHGAIAAALGVCTKTVQRARCWLKTYQDERRRIA